MSNFRPSLPYTVPMHVLRVIGTEKVKGSTVKTYAEPSADNLFYGSFKTFGGTESNKNGVYSVIDTANIETYYRPDITADCRIVLADTGVTYEVLGTPENINMRNQFLKFKVQSVRGGA